MERWDTTTSATGRSGSISWFSLDYSRSHCRPRPHSESVVKRLGQPTYCSVPRLAAASFVSRGSAGGDLLNLVPLAAAIFLMGSAVFACKGFGLASAFFPRWMGNPLFRSAALTVLLLFLAEFALRCGGYHRTVMYERQGDLLFTPVQPELHGKNLAYPNSYQQLRSSRR